MSKAIEVRGLRREFVKGDSKIQVLDNVDLDIDPGEFVALMGPSGSGKTTLLNIIAGIDRPTSGAVSVEGNDLLAMTEAQKTSWRTRSIGYVFQYRNLLPVLKASENVELPLLLLPLSKKERREHVAAALEAVGLTDRAEHYPRQLSGGEELRVAIARAVVTDARIILADEPTGSLDAEAAKGIMELLGRLNAEFSKTVVMVTHDAKAAGHAGRMLRMEKGHLIHGDKEVAANAV